MDYTGTPTAAPAAISISISGGNNNAAGEGSLSSASPTSSSSSPTSSPPPAAAVILSPCAACKILRRRCIDKCVLAPYFPPTEPLKFTIAHRVFGASNIIKLLQELPEDQRADAVNSMVYEANARLRDPVYGCAGAICQLQKQISELQTELAKAQAEVVTMQCQNSNLFELICKQVAAAQNEHHQVLMEHEPILPYYDSNSMNISSSIFFDEGFGEPLWT